MNDKDLHTILSKLQDAQPSLPRHQARTRALVLQEYTRQQTSFRHTLSTFMRQLIQGKTMKISFTSPLVIAGIMLLTGTASAAALYWFNTSVSSSTNNSIVSISADNCPSVPASQTRAVGVTLPVVYSFNEKYQIIDGSKINQQQIMQAALAMCEERAIAAGINQAFPDMQEFSATKLAPNSKGLYFPIYLSGTISAVQGDQLTIDNLSSNSANATTATFQLANGALLTKESRHIGNVQVGDNVYFAYQNRAVAGETPNQSNLNSLEMTTDPGSLSVIRGIGVLTTDNDALQKLQAAISSGAVKVLQSDPRQG